MLRTEVPVKTRMAIALLLVSALTAGIGSAQPAKGENVKIYAAAVAKTPLTAIAADFEKTTGNMVTLVFDTAGATEQRFRADPEASLLITTVPLIRNAESSGTLKMVPARFWAARSPAWPCLQNPRNPTSPAPRN